MPIDELRAKRYRAIQREPNDEAALLAYRGSRFGLLITLNHYKKRSRRPRWWSNFLWRIGWSLGDPAYYEEHVSQIQRDMATLRNAYYGRKKLLKDTPLDFTWEPYNNTFILIDKEGDGRHPATYYEDRMIREIERLRSSVGKSLDFAVDEGAATDYKIALVDMRKALDKLRDEAFPDAVPDL